MFSEVLLFVGHWRLVVEGRVQPVRVVEAFDVVEDCEPSLRSAKEYLSLDKLTFERRKERLAHCAHVAVANRAH